MQNIIENHLYKRSLLSYLLWPISFKYSLILKLRRLLANQGYRSKCKIISVGNIVSGGSGKTPLTIFLAKHLTEKGFNVAVSHRGYKGKFEHKNKLISDHSDVFDSARDAGDEAFLLATKLPGIPVITGRNRKRSIQILEEKYPDLGYIILDDSFQHLKVFHDLDFVIFNEIGGIGNGFVLPAGILREPLSALKFADYIVFNGKGEIPWLLLKYNKPILRGGYKVNRFYDTDGNDITPVGKIALLSAIGLPRSFEKTIKEAGLFYEKHYRFPDHYDFKDKAILQKIETELKKEKIDYLLITEKDFAKLRFIEHNLPLVVVEVEFKLLNLEEMKM
ncbi:MAG: tetraacyldisaccharide 4'-kinase [Candidatus Cloacimonetes bacterium]|nr:tetraacyldisaccharide 4'-kinase [Candidatus Cloacimonadota bacterium]MBL7148860.1 tetraacyldisaccharide 4'-kinase [Candidatus Cloacimonadota bacterium]